MYIAGFITDTHLAKDNLELNLDIFKQSIDICKKHKIRLYHGGDFLEKRGQFQNYDVKEGFEAILDLFKKENLELHGCMGNHDKVSYTSEGGWLTQHKHHPNFDLVEGYGYDDIKGKDIDFRIHIIPFFEENINYRDYLDKAKKNLSKDSKNILLTHVAITGAQNNDATKVENNLSVKDFKEFDLVLSGHYHQNQTIKNFIYFGSAYQANFGEDNQKGITLLKDDGTLEFIKLDFKEYVKVQIDIDTKTQKEVDTIAKKYFKSDNNIRIELTGTQSKINSIKKDVFKENGIDIKTKTKEVEDTTIYDEGTEVQQFDSSSIKEELIVFCEENELDIETANKYLKKQLNE